MQNYPILLRQMKQRVALAQQRAIFAANEELLRMYWDLGQILYMAQHAEGWGKGTLARLSEDMKNEYPEEKGFSVREYVCKKPYPVRLAFYLILAFAIIIFGAYGRQFILKDFIYMDF